MSHFMAVPGFTKTLLAGAISAVMLSGCNYSGMQGGTNLVPVVGPKLTGALLDPYLVYAKVWCDVDGNGRYDATDPSVRSLGPTTTTDSTKYGSFTFSDTQLTTCGSAIVYADGDATTEHVDEMGTKISGWTGRMVLGAADAAAGSVNTNVTPLVNLKALLGIEGTAAATAEANIRTVFGLTSVYVGTSLENIDFSDTSIPANKAVVKAALLVQQLTNDISAALQGVSGGTITPHSSGAVGKQLALIVNTLAGSGKSIIDSATGAINPALVSSTLRQTMTNTAAAVPSYNDYDTDTIVAVVGESVVNSAIKSATAAAEANNFSDLTQDLQLTQGSNTEMLRVTMDAVSGLLDGSADLDGDGVPDVAQGADPAAVAAQMDAMINAVSAGLAAAASTDLSGATDPAQIAAAVSESIGTEMAKDATIAGLADGVTAAAQESAASAQTQLAAIGSTTNNLPEATAGAKTVRAGQTVTGQAKATDLDGNGLTYASASAPTQGTLTFGADGAYSYLANADAAGSDSFTFTANDGIANSAPATVTISVVPDFAPVASVAKLTVFEGDAGTGLALPIFSADNDPYITETVGSPVSGITINANGTFDFAAPDVLADTTYSVGYLVKETDAAGNVTGKIAQASVDMTVLYIPPNNPPKANDVRLEGTLVGAATTMTTTGSFSGSDLDGDVLTYNKVSNPASGTVTVTGKSFTVDNLAAGNYSFSYGVTDAAGSNTTTNAMVYITVNAANRAPIVASTSVAKAVKQGGAVTIDITAYDPDGDAITYSNSASAQGALTNVGGVFTYTAGNTATFGATIDDTFTLTATDSNSNATNVTVNVDISEANTAPVAPNDVVTLDLNGGPGTITGSWTAPVYEPDSDTYTCAFNTAALPAGTTATPTGCTVSLTGTAVGAGSFTYTVTDAPAAGTAKSATGTVNVNVISSAVDRAPIAAPISITLNDQATAATLQLTGIDLDGDAITAYALTDPSGGPTTPPTGVSLNTTSGVLTADGTQLTLGLTTGYYTVTANGLTSAPAAITVNVTHVNQPAAVIDTSTGALLAVTDGSNPNVSLATGVVIPMGSRDGLMAIGGKIGLHMAHQTALYSLDLVLDNARAEFDAGGNLVNAYIPDGATVHASGVNSGGAVISATIINNLQQLSDGVSVVGGELVLNLQAVANKVAAQGQSIDVLSNPASTGVYDIKITIETGETVVDLGGNLAAGTVSATVGGTPYSVNGPTLTGTITYSLN